jgi:tetratricopeptide (TPR) repeat protein
MIVLLCLQLAAFLTFAQPARLQKEAQQLAKEAGESIGTGEFHTAAEKFARASKLDPKNVDYQIGLANARFFLQDHAGAMALCKPLMTGKSPNAEAFQVYGSCQDALGQSYEALATFREGLVHFPKSGALYMEMGIVEFGRNRDVEALGYWEEGIRVQPAYAANYYFAALVLLKLGDYAWAANYAELFINLSRNEQRVTEMSLLVMAANEGARVFDYQEAFRWRFFQPLDSVPLGSREVWPYYQLLNEAYSSEFTDTTTHISIARLADIRRFVAYWLPRQDPQNPAMNLYRWQQRVVDAGFWEAYNYWLLADARREKALNWFENNKSEFEEFESWLMRNSIHKHLKRAVVRPN